MAEKYREVICPYCGNVQDEPEADDSFVCGNCDCQEIFTVEEQPNG